MNNNRVHIEDISKLRITKVKPWKIYFKYDKDEYMLLDDSDEESHISLYKRYKLPSGNHRAECINGAVTCMSISDFIKVIAKGRQDNIVYANIDRNYFVIKLLELGFSSGYLEERNNNFIRKDLELRDEIEELRYRISILQGKISELHRDKENGLPKIGSKTARGNKIKREIAERVHGKKSGEWCEQYKDYYGNSEPVYGGTLIDLYNLPVGTHFDVANGCWRGLIGYDEHGDKCIITDVNTIKLTHDYHSAYIENVF